MTDRRLVLEHPDGRRLSIGEADLDRAESNPYNHGGDRHTWNADLRETVIRAIPPRPMDDWQSLKAEGFVAVAYIHGDRCTKACCHDPDVEVQAGHEIALEARP